MKWNNQEKEFLIENYEKMGLNWCLKKLKRSKTSVSLMAKRLDLSCKNKLKSCDEFIKNNYIKYGSDFCATKLNKNKKWVIKRASLLKVNPNTRWTKEKELFLIKNYSDKGSSYCASILKIETKKIIQKANSLGLKLSKEISLKIKKDAMDLYYKNKKFEDFRVNPEIFINIKTPEVAYILGFIWADGHISQHGTNNTIKVDVNSKDFKDLKAIFEKTGAWRFYHYIRYNKYKCSIITTNNRPILEFLVKNDYRKKSLLSPNKIIETIPKKILHYFFRGWSDGDGCFYFSKTNNSYTVSGSYEQNWDSFSKMLNTLNINHKITKRVNKKNQRCSIITIQNKMSIIKFGNFIYKNFNKDNIGFKRKHDIFSVIKSSVNKKLASI